MVTVIATPCHTRGHVCYLGAMPASAESCASSAEAPPPVVFTGDTLFVAGCGRFNTGTPAQMLENLRDK